MRFGWAEPGATSPEAIQAAQAQGTVKGRVSDGSGGSGSGGSGSGVSGSAGSGTGGSGSGGSGGSGGQNSEQASSSGGHSISFKALEALRDIVLSEASPTAKSQLSQTSPSAAAQQQGRSAPAQTLQYLVPAVNADADGDEEDEQTTSASARVRASWLLIWCHERCYKPERLGLRAHLTDVAMKLSAGILCMKKAVKYEAWMKRTNTKFHVLITDWREAKPCIQAVGESQQEDSWPEMIIILCELPKSYENAVQWASRQSSTKTPIRVVFEDPEQTHFQVMENLLHECYEMMLRRRPMLMPFNPGLLSQPEGSDLRAIVEQQGPWEAASEADSDEIRNKFRAGTIISL